MVLICSFVQHIITSNSNFRKEYSTKRKSSSISLVSMFIKFFCVIFFFCFFFLLFSFSLSFFRLFDVISWFITLFSPHCSHFYPLTYCVKYNKPMAPITFDSIRLHSDELPFGMLRYCYFNHKIAVIRTRGGIWFYFNLVFIRHAILRLQQGQPTNHCTLYAVRMVVWYSFLCESAGLNNSN